MSKKEKAEEVVAKSYFDGNGLQKFGWTVLTFLVTLITLGIAYPWSVCKLYGWEIKHTVIEGKRLRFDATAIQLFGTWIKWWLLTIITIGIFGLLVPGKVRKWKIKHTRFQD